MKRLYYYNEINNFGDMLSKYLFEKISGEVPIYDDKFLNEYYVFIGSLLHSYYINENAIVCGAGFICQEDKLCKKPKEIFSVRGPLTHKKLLELGNDCSPLYGDPGIVISEYYKIKNNKKYDIGIIPHFVDYNNIIHKVKNQNIKIINVLNDNIEEIINEINECGMILSSSLHGLITAHSYNIPALWIEFSNKVIGDGFKFFDYFDSVNIKRYRINNIELCEKNIKNIFKEYQSQHTVYFDIKNYSNKLKNRLS
jgi:pyruvyltransferase